MFLFPRNFMISFETIIIIFIVIVNNNDINIFFGLFTVDWKKYKCYSRTWDKIGTTYTAVLIEFN